MLVIYKKDRKQIFRCIQLHTFCLSRLLTSLMRIFAWSLAYNTNIQVNHRFTLTVEDTFPLAKIISICLMPEK